MSAATAKYGILVGVDGSAQSNAAVAWAAREAVMRQLPITLLHIVAPVVVGWPVGQLYANMTEWQKDNAQQVIEQAREALTNSLGESKPPQVHTELVFSNVVPTLIDASQQAWLMVVGSQGMGALGRLLLGSIAPRCSTMRGVQWPSFIPVMARLPTPMHRCWWASTDRQPLRRQRP